MKKSSKPLIIIITTLLVLITLIVLISQGLRLKYEELQREIAQMEYQIKTEKTQSVGLKANYQMLTAEDVIKKYAMNELGLVDAGSDPTRVVILSSEDIAHLSENVLNSNE